MVRKTLLSITLALAAVVVLVFGVTAQTPDDDVITVEPLVASLQQVVPVTLTVVIPSPTGPITLEVPVFLTLDIRLGVGSDLTATLAATPSLTLVGVEPVATALPEEEEATDEEAAEEEAVEEEAEPEATATPPPTPTATPVLPTATPALPTATPIPLPTPTPQAPPVTAPVCPDARAVLTSPGNNQVVAGPAVAILGTATHANFQYYKLEIAPGANAEGAFEFLGDVRTPVESGVLGSLDSTLYVNGVYTLRLTVVDNSGNFPPPCSANIVIAN
jgi:hypothetical protein